MKPSNTTTSGKATDVIAGICTLPRLPCPCTKRHIMLNLSSTGVCNIGTSALYVCNLLLWITWWWMLLYRTLRKVSSTNMRKNRYVVTPRCAVAAAAIVSAVVLRQPTKEYTHPYPLINRRLPTAGDEVALHYHQLLVMKRASEASLLFLGFPRKKKPRHNGGYEHRVTKIKNKTSCCTRYVCVRGCLCVIQHRNCPLRSTILNAHGTNASPDGLCTRTHTNEAFSSWFCCNSFRVDRARRGNVCL